MFNSQDTNARGYQGYGSRQPARRFRMNDGTIRQQSRLQAAITANATIPQPFRFAPHPQRKQEIPIAPAIGSVPFKARPLPAFYNTHSNNTSANTSFVQPEQRRCTSALDFYSTMPLPTLRPIGATILAQGPPQLSTQERARQREIYDEQRRERERRREQDRQHKEMMRALAEQQEIQQIRERTVFRARGIGYKRND